MSTSIWSWDSNPQPSAHESPPKTTRPGLPHCFYYTQPRMGQSQPHFSMEKIFYGIQTWIIGVERKHAVK